MKHLGDFHGTDERIASASRVKAPNQSARIDAMPPRKLSSSYTLAAELDISGVAGIERLLGPRYPSAIAWFIVAVDIVTLDRMPPTWHWPHVSEEIFKAAKPSRADDNAASAVSVIRGVLFVRAALLHVAPALIFSRQIETVLCCAGLCDLARKASA